MYPNYELTCGVTRKAVLRRRIGRHRNQCLAAVARVAEPLALLDQFVRLGRKLAPYAGLAAIVLSIRRKRIHSPRTKLFRSLIRWGPLVSGLLRLFRPMARARFGGKGR